MPKKQSRDDGTYRNAEPRIERTDERSSPGSGEEEGPADLQPDEVENGPAR